MVAMDEFAEPRRTPSLHHVSAQSPRVGGCVGAFFHLLDWNPSKRLFSTKRLTADRPNQGTAHARKDRGFKDRMNPSGAKVLLINEESTAFSNAGVFSAPGSKPTLTTTTPSPESIKSDDANKRVPGVVARLMGLESLPDTESCVPSKLECLDKDCLFEVAREQSGSPPMLLQELLRQEFQYSRKTLKEKLPGFTKKPLDSKPPRGPAAPRRPPPPAPKSARQPGKKFSSQDEVKHSSPKQPFLARLQGPAPEVVPAPAHSKASQNHMSPCSPARSPRKLGAKNTARLLEAAVKILEPNMQPGPRSRYGLQRELTHRDSGSDSGASTRSERRTSTTSSGYGARAGGSVASSTTSSKSLKGQSLSRTWNGKDDRGEQSGHLVVENVQLGSRTSHHESSRQDVASRRRFESALAASARSVSPPRSSHRSRPTNSKRTEKPPRNHVLGTDEASIRGFKINLGSQAYHAAAKKAEGTLSSSAPREANRKLSAAPSSPAEPEVVEEENIPSTPRSSSAPNCEEEEELVPARSGGSAKEDNVPGPRQEEDDDLNANHVAVGNVDQESMSPAKDTSPVSAKSASAGGFRSIRFRGKTGKQEKDLGAQGNRVFPSEKHVGPQDGQQDVVIRPPKEAKVAGPGLLTYSMLFSNRKQGDKKEGNSKGEALVLKRTESVLMRSLLRRPSTTATTSPQNPKPGVEIKGKKNLKAEKKAATEAAHAEAEAVTRLQLGPQVLNDVKEASSATCVRKDALTSPTAKRCEGGKDGSPLQQTRYRSVDDVFPELPLEASDVGAASPDLGKTIKAVEDQFLGFGLQGETALFDCRSIERMFGKGVARTFGSSFSPSSPDLFALENPAPGTSPVSPEIFNLECGTRTGTTFPNSPLVNYEKMFFSSRGHPNLQDLFESVSGDRSVQDLTGRRRSFCLSEPRERVLTPSDDEEAGADVDTCSNSAVCDTGSTPERLEIQTMPMDAGWSEDVVTPISLKKFVEKIPASLMEPDQAHVSGVHEECGQPSPVSVLESPFLDEILSTPDASITESEPQVEDSPGESCTSNAKPQLPHAEPCEGKPKETKTSNMLAGTQESVEAAALPEMIETEKIKQAILEISRFRNIDVSAIGLGEPTIITPVSPHEELNYIREVLDAGSLLVADCNGAGRNACNVPMNPSLFDRLEFGSIKLDERTLMESSRWGDLPEPQRQGSHIRSERRLLFDCVNEVMVLEPWMKTSSFYCGMPMFPEMHSKSKFRRQVSGEKLVAEVHGMICHWRGIAGNVLDDLIDYDMSVPEGKWVDFTHEVAAVGLDIESMLMKVMIDEVVNDLWSISTLRSISTC